MTTTLYTGYWALGTGSGTTFTEISGTGYARVAGAIQTASGNRHTNSAVATFTASGSNWGTATQIGIYSASSSGTLKMFWNMTNSHTIANTKSFTIAALSLNLLFDAMIYHAGASVQFATSGVMGHDAGGNSIFAGSPLIVTSGVVQATTPVLYAATGALPTSDPHVVGQIWSNSSVITISAG